MKLESFTSKTGDYTRLEMENSHLTEQLQNLEQELKDAKCSLTEKRERLALNEVSFYEKFIICSLWVSPLV